MKNSSLNLSIRIIYVLLDFRKGKKKTQTHNTAENKRMIYPVMLKKQVWNSCWLKKMQVGTGLFPYSGI